MKIDWNIILIVVIAIALLIVSIYNEDSLRALTAGILIYIAALKMEINTLKSKTKDL